MAIQQDTSSIAVSPLLNTSVLWTRTGDPDRMYTTTVGDETWDVRINEFPDEPHMFTLLINGTAVVDFNDWPKHWQRPVAKTTFSTPQTPPTPAAQTPLD